MTRMKRRTPSSMRPCKHQSFAGIVVLLLVGAAHALPWRPKRSLRQNFSIQKGAVLSLRGGGTSQIIVEELMASSGGGVLSKSGLDRIMMRLEGLDTYAIIASIFLGSIVDVYRSCPTGNNHLSDEEQHTGSRWTARSVAQAVHGSSIMASTFGCLYVITTFSLLNLYSKTALGWGKDAIYAQLMQDTHAFRRLGFYAFLISLVAFECALVANFFLNFTGRAQWILSGCMGLGMVLSLSEWATIVRCASRTIFTND